MTADPMVPAATAGAGMHQLASFVATAPVPAAARARALTAMLDTVGVTLAGAVEPGSRIVQRLVAREGGPGPCGVFGTAQRTSASMAALANGTAAHALDYDDICFVSLTHPSAPLVAAALALGEVARAVGRTVLDGYVVGYEVDAILGRALNPAHYQRGWHNTSTIGTVGATATAARVLGLDADGTRRALAIAASEASGLKENFGTMVKPLHAGLAARNAVLAALLARDGFTASEQALEGPQGLLAAMDASDRDLAASAAAAGRRWQILETGIAVKLYPSCAATHPPLDALLDLRRRYGFTPEEVEGIDIAVDAMTPTVLIYDCPTTGLEGKFSLPYCAAAAVLDGRVDLATFDDARLADAQLQQLRERVVMRVEPELGRDAPSLTQARVSVRLRDGRTLTQSADGARGYPANPATSEELEAKFRRCAARSLPDAAVDAALVALRRLDSLPYVGELTRWLSTEDVVD